MNKEEFLLRLERLLYDIPREEREEALEYYRNYFADAGEENEAAVLAELGSPEKAAAGIREGLAAPEGGSLEHPPVFSGKAKESSGTGRNWRSAFRDMDKQSRMILLIITAILAFPVWSGAAAGLLGLLAGAVCLILGIVLALGVLSVGGAVGGLACAAVGIYVCARALPYGLLLLGVGLLLLAVGCISVVLLLLLCSKTFPWLVGAASDLLRRLWKWGRSLA